MKRNNWSIEEKEILKEHSQPNTWVSSIELHGKYLLNRTESSILHQRRQLRLYVTKSNWGDEELRILRENHLLPIDEIHNKLPNRTINSIKYKREKMHLLPRKSRGIRWSDKETEILRNNSQPDNWLSLKELHKNYLPERSEYCISTKRTHLELTQLGKNMKCDNCGKIFPRNHPTQKYCSPKCSAEYKIKIYKKREKRKLILHEKICPVCGKKFSVRSLYQKHCSYSCAHKDHPNKKIESKCKYCGRIIIWKPSTNRKYCNRKCYWKASRKHTWNDKQLRKLIESYYKRISIKKMVTILDVSENAIHSKMTLLNLPKLFKNQNKNESEIHNP